LYLAKDSRQLDSVFRNTYTHLREWEHIRECSCRGAVIASDLSGRIGLV